MTSGAWRKNSICPIAWTDQYGEPVQGISTTLPVVARPSNCR
jgi:hypothetical protein